MARRGGRGPAQLPRLRTLRFPAKTAGVKAACRIPNPGGPSPNAGSWTCQCWLTTWGGLGDDTVREMDASGVLTPARVRLPAGTGRQLRKVLFDREPPNVCDHTYCKAKRARRGGFRDPG